MCEKRKSSSQPTQKKKKKKKRTNYIACMKIGFNFVGLSLVLSQCGFQVNISRRSATLSNFNTRQHLFDPGANFYHKEFQISSYITKDKNEN
jgi:hypothetical protein